MSFFSAAYGFKYVLLSGLTTLKNDCVAVERGMFLAVVNVNYSIVGKLDLIQCFWLHWNLASGPSQLTIWGGSHFTDFDWIIIDVPAFTVHLVCVLEIYLYIYIYNPGHLYMLYVSTKLMRMFCYNLLYSFWFDDRCSGKMFFCCNHGLNLFVECKERLNADAPSTSRSDLDIHIWAVSASH